MHILKQDEEQNPRRETGPSNGKGDLPAHSIGEPSPEWPKPSREGA